MQVIRMEWSGGPYCLPSSCPILLPVLTQDEPVELLMGLVKGYLFCSSKMEGLKNRTSKRRAADWES